MLRDGRRGPAFWLLGGFFVLFVLFLYGPLSTIVILSFQGPDGGLTFPMNGVSLHWFGNLFEKQAVGDFGGSFLRSLILGLMVMVVDRRGLAARRPRLPPALPRLDVPVLPRGREPDRAVDPGQPRHRPRLPDRRHPAGLVFLGLRRAADLDAALRPPDHVRRVQPLQPLLRGGGPRPRRLVRGRPSATSCCRSSCRA